jgi:hypothetical protein
MESGLQRLVSLGAGRVAALSLEIGLLQRNTL